MVALRFSAGVSSGDDSPPDAGSRGCGVAFWTPLLDFRLDLRVVGMMMMIAISLPPVLLLVFRPWNLESQQ
jgi:hypothetical protein